MKRVISILMAFFIILGSLIGTGCSTKITKDETMNNTTDEGIADTKDESLSDTKDEGVTNTKDESAHILDGKKIIFIGNSFTHYGNCVIRKDQSIRSQKQRNNDRGYFYQLCKKNGAQVSVTNWCYGGHSLEDLFEVCNADRGCDGVVHQNDLVDRNYDYVVLQQGSRNNSSNISEFMKKCDLVMDFFKEANPDVKFVFLLQERAHTGNYIWLSEVKKLEQKGVIIVDWGKLVYDVINGNVSVPNATQEYNKNSFIVCQSETDGYHPSILTGYITTLMTYCAITGESAVGQDYSFCNKSSISSNFDFNRFIRLYYTYDNATTNFPEIFESESDMAGIQQLIDQYIANKPYLNY